MLLSTCFLLRDYLFLGSLAREQTFIRTFCLCPLGFLCPQLLPLHVWDRRSKMKTQGTQDSLLCCEVPSGYVIFSLPFSFLMFCFVSFFGLVCFCYFMYVCICLFVYTLCTIILFLAGVIKEHMSTPSSWKQKSYSLPFNYE